MQYIPIISQHDLFLDVDNLPINGKLEIVDPNTNNMVPVYTWSHEQMVPATNPILLTGGGRPDDTYFVQQLVQIKIYRYLGDFRLPMDTEDSANWQYIREYMAGEDPDLLMRETAHTMAELREMDVATGTVNVIGYHNEYDCPMRTYVWDNNCALDDDGGYVVASDNTETGRWVLVFNGAYIPSVYYGVYPGHTENMNALCTYAGMIHGQHTAPGIFFAPGNYGDTMAITTKKVLLSSNTQMNTIECSWIDVIGRPTTWIANIFPSDVTCPVYSSWYKHARSFWGNSSRVKHADGRNWINDDIVANMTNTNVTFITHQGTKLTTNTGAYKLIFNNCRVEGDYGFLDKDSTCRFISMEMSDKFYNANSITPANIEFSTVSGQGATLILDHFARVENYAALLYKTGTTTIDMGNVYCGGTSSVDLSEYLVIRNLSGNMITVGKANGSAVSLYDSSVSNLTIQNANLSLDHTNARIISFPQNFSQLSVGNNSTIQGGFTLTKGAVTCIDSTWGMAINEVTDNTTLSPSIVFRKSIITGITIQTKNIQVYDSRLTNAIVKIYPYKNNNKYWLFGRFERNDITNTDNPAIQFTMLSGDNLCKDCWWNFRMIGNDFQGNELGVTCPYWTIGTVSNVTQFIARDHANGGFIVKQNTGNCPKCADFQAVLQSPAQYSFNTNLDYWSSDNVPIKVLGTVQPVRIWCVYWGNGIGSTQGGLAYENAIKGKIAVGRSWKNVDTTLNLNGKPLVGWHDFWISNASFGYYNVDSSYTGPRTQEELNDWFAARICQYVDSDSDIIGRDQDMDNICYIIG